MPKFRDDFDFALRAVTTNWSQVMIDAVDNAVIRNVMSVSEASAIKMKLNDIVEAIAETNPVPPDATPVVSILTKQ